MTSPPRISSSRASLPELDPPIPVGCQKSMGPVTSGSGLASGYDASSLARLPLRGARGLVIRLPGVGPRPWADRALLSVGRGQGDPDPGAAPRACCAASPASAATAAIQGRALLAALSRHLRRARWSVFLVKPQTLLGWHRRMVRRRWTYPIASSGRPPVPDHVQPLIVRLARENPRWATSGSAANYCALAAGSQPARSGGCCEPTGRCCVAPTQGGLKP
jgi:hypothetical protein